MEYLKNMTSDYFKMLKDVRQAYIQNWNGRRRQDPYKFGDWFRYLTPIEHNVWNDIRYLGLPFYPQFPVGKYYIDFADPFEKIALEIDGKIHQDPEVALRDADKTKFLNSKGWRVVRIPGWKTFRGRKDYLNDDCDHYGEVVDQYYTNTAQAILEEIKNRFYDSNYPSLRDD
jgi:very-short-patch-repair endonuclease